MGNRVRARIYRGRQTVKHKVEVSTTLLILRNFHVFFYDINKILDIRYEALDLDKAADYLLSTCLYRERQRDGDVVSSINGGHN